MSATTIGAIVAIALGVVVFLWLQKRGKGGP
jgi:hypothetical protein